jgi:flagellar L-ring protein FlgH
MLKFMTFAMMTLIAAPSAAQSLYSEQTYVSLVADHRARQVGDSLTVLVFESSSASATADAGMQRGSDIGLSASLDQRSHRANVGVGNHFDGGGTVRRSGRLLAQLTVDVVDIADNGDLYISGEQHVEINSDEQHFNLEGRVRRADITSGNTVMSNRIAQARIRYIGEGDLADIQRPGLFSRIMAWLGL